MEEIIHVTVTQAGVRGWGRKDSAPRTKVFDEGRGVMGGVVLFLGMNAQLCCGEEPVCDWGEERSLALFSYQNSQGSRPSMGGVRQVTGKWYKRL